MRPDGGLFAHAHKTRDTNPAPIGGSWPVEICLLGGFRLLKAGEVVTGRAGGKIEALLCNLALGTRYGRPRDHLLNALWPESERALAGRSLNTLVYSVHCLLGEEIDAPPIITERGVYRLNVEAGISIDVARFDKLANAGDLRFRSGDEAGAAACYADAAELYQGDLCVATEIDSVIERERLRARYLRVLARLAKHAYAQADYASCLDRALELLRADPCREDAHRLVMLSHLRQGERAQAIRQFRVCEQVLRAELEASPEPATVELFEKIRLQPECV